MPYAVDGSLLGEATIQVVGPRRQSRLTEQRREHLAILQKLQRIVDNAAVFVTTPEEQQLVADAREFLRTAVLDSAPFAAMTRAAAKAGFRAPIL